MQTNQYGNAKKATPFSFILFSLLTWGYCSMLLAMDAAYSPSSLPLSLQQTDRNYDTATHPVWHQSNELTVFNSDSLNEPNPATTIKKHHPISPNKPLFVMLKPSQALKMESKDKDKTTLINIYVSQGRGVFPASPYTQWHTQETFYYTNVISRPIWLMLSSEETINVAVYAKKTHAFPSKHLWFPVTLDNQRTIDVNFSSKSGQRKLLPLSQYDTFRYQAKKDEYLKIQFWSDFHHLANATNVPVHLEWQVDKQTKQIKTVYANFDYTIRHSASECNMALSFPQELIIPLKAEQTLWFNASQAGYIALQQNQPKNTLFRKNRPKLSTTPVWNKSALQHEKWYSLLKALDIPIRLNLSPSNNKLTTRRHLFPVTNQRNSLQLYSVRGGSIDQNDQDKQFLFSRQNSHSNFQKLILGHYAELSREQDSLKYKLPKNRVLKELEIEVATHKNQGKLIPINVSFDQRSPSTWLIATDVLAWSAQPSQLSYYLETAFKPTRNNQAKDPVSYHNDFARFKTKAPMVQTNIAYLPVPENARSVTFTLPNPQAQTKTALYLSVRDFIYRSNLPDINFLNESQARTLQRVMVAYHHFHTAQLIVKKKTHSKNKLSQLPNLHQGLFSFLESLSLPEQIDLIVWARFFESAKKAHESLALKYSPNSHPYIASKGSIDWQNIERWLDGEQPDISLHYLSGMAIHHPEQATRQRAINQLYQRVDTLIAPVRMEQVLLASLYQDMTQIEILLPKLLWLWSKQGKYTLISLLPKPPALQADYDLLTNINEQRKQQADNLLTSTKLSDGFKSLANLYQNYESKLQTKEQSGQINKFEHEDTHYLSRFVYWKPDQTPVRQYDRHYRLEHTGRPDLTRAVFMLSPKETITLRSHDLDQYRIRVAAILKPDHVIKGKTSLFNITMHSQGAQQTQFFSMLTQSDWLIKDAATSEHKPLTQFNTLPLKKLSPGVSMQIAANTDAVIFLERKQDPIGLLKMQARPLEKVKFDSSANQEQYTQADFANHIVSYDSGCQQTQAHTLTQTQQYRAVNVAGITLDTVQSKPMALESSSKHFRELLAPSISNALIKKLQTHDIGAAATLLEQANSPKWRHFTPNIRGTVFQFMRWRELHDINAPAGLQTRELSQTLPLSQAAQQHAQFALLQPLPQSPYSLSPNPLLPSFSITGDRVQGFQVKHSNDKQHNLLLFSPKLSFQQAQTLYAWVQYDNQIPKKISLNNGKPSWIPIPKQQVKHTIKVWLDKVSYTERLYLQLYDEGSGNTAVARKQAFYVAAKNNPITVKLFGPQRLKVVQTNDQQETWVEEKFIPPGWHTLDFKAHRKPQYYRFFVLQENYQTSPRWPAITTQLETQADCRLEANCLTRHHTRLQDTAFYQPLVARYQSRYYQDTQSNQQHKTLKQSQYSDIELFLRQSSKLTQLSEGPTYGFILTYGDRRQSEEESDSQDGLLDNFWQAHGLVRQFNDQDRQLYSLDARLRQYEGTQVRHFSGRIDWLPKSHISSFDFSLEGHLWHQNSRQTSPSVKSGQVVARASYDKQLTQRHRIASEVRLWQRFSNADKQSNLQNIDPDVWSNYKQSHQRGFSIQQRGVYRTTMDSEVYGQVRALFNDNLVSLDQQSARLGWRHYLNTLSTDVNVRHRRFSNDDDRNNPSHQTSFNLSTDWLKAFSDSSNISLGARFNYNADNNNLSWWFNLGWHQHRGQQLYDFRPGEYRYREARQWWLRESKMPQENQ